MYFLRSNERDNEIHTLFGFFRTWVRAFDNSVFCAVKNSMAQILTLFGKVSEIADCALSLWISWAKIVLIDFFVGFHRCFAMLWIMFWWLLWKIMLLCGKLEVKPFWKSRKKDFLRYFVVSVLGNAKYTGVSSVFLYRLRKEKSKACWKVSGKLAGEFL